MFFEDREVLGDHAEYGEAQGDDRQRDGYFGPARNVVRAGTGFHAGDGDVQAIGNEAEQDHDGAAIQFRRVPTNAAAEQQNHGHGQQHDFEPEQPGFGTVQE